MSNCVTTTIFPECQDGQGGVLAVLTRHGGHPAPRGAANGQLMAFKKGVSHA